MAEINQVIIGILVYKVSIEKPGEIINSIFLKTGKDERFFDLFGSPLEMAIITGTIRRMNENVNNPNGSFLIRKRILCS